MPLPSSGAISLNQIHVEAGGTSGSVVTINDADVRGLISKGSATNMSFSEWYGASSFNGREADAVLRMNNFVEYDPTVRMYLESASENFMSGQTCLQVDEKHDHIIDPNGTAVNQYGEHPSSLTGSQNTLPPTFGGSGGYANWRINIYMLIRTGGATNTIPNNGNPSVGTTIPTSTSGLTQTNSSGYIKLQMIAPNTTTVSTVQDQLKMSFAFDFNGSTYTYNTANPTGYFRTQDSDSTYADFPSRSVHEFYFNRGISINTSGATYPAYFTNFEYFIEEQ